MKIYDYYIPFNDQAVLNMVVSDKAYEWFSFYGQSDLDLYDIAEDLKISLEDTEKTMNYKEAYNFAYQNMNPNSSIVLSIIEVAELVLKEYRTILSNHGIIEGDE